MMVERENQIMVVSRQSGWEGTRARMAWATLQATVYIKKLYTAMPKKKYAAIITGPLA